MADRLLTEPEAWREIARRMAESERVTIGLCHEVHALAYTLASVDRVTMDDMLQRINEQLGFTFYAYPPGEDVEARILAALWLALEAEEEQA